MRIACPHCGERHLEEFSYLGDANVVRPDPSVAGAADAFYAFGYERRNTPGVMDELWYHASGCHAWLVVSRDTRTHEIFAVRPAHDIALAREKKTAGGSP